MRRIERMHCRQRGFTLLEVIVAFAIFALTIGALFETFGGALRRSVQASGQELAWLTAQSLLTERRMQPAPWHLDDSGTSSAGLHWQIHAEPFEVPVDRATEWRAYAVSVQVVALGSRRSVKLESIELARMSP
jgi:general secretion pathway protein I